MSNRLDYPQSCARLRELGLLGPDENPPIPNKMPAYDDEEPRGVEFFRTEVGRFDLTNLTLPRTYFGRSRIGAKFDRTDLHESCMNWCDVFGASFAGSNLSGCDLRASNFLRVAFDDADLRGVDLRHANFEYCAFTNARFDGAIAPADPGFIIAPAQRAVMVWPADQGPEPDGG